MNKFKLTPVIALTREDAQIEAMNDQVASLLKDPSIDTELKMAIYQDLLSKIRSYREVPRKEEPQMMVRESRTTQTPKKAIRRGEVAVEDAPVQTETQTSDSFAQTLFSQGDFGLEEAPELGYSPVIHEKFNRNTPRPATNTTVTSIQSSPQVTSRSFSLHSTQNSPRSTRSSLRTPRSRKSNRSNITSPLVSPQSTHTALSPLPLNTPKRETTNEFFDRLSKGGRRQPTRASPQKTRSFVTNQTGNGFISKKRWLFS